MLESESNMNPSHQMRSRVVSSRYKQSATEVSNRVSTNHSSGHSSSGSSFENSKWRAKKPMKVGKSNPKLHSTAVNSTTFFDKTQVGATDIFSTTVVGGHGKHSNVTLAELSSISQIPPSSVIKKPKADKEVLQPRQDDPFHARDFSQDEVRKEYLHYLTWAWIDAKTKKAFETQVEEAQKQISSLTQLLEDEEDQLCEEQLKVQLLRHHEEVCQDYENLKLELNQLTDTAEPCAEALRSLSCHLEAKINQINLDAIYTPDPSQEESYKEELQDALLENCSRLTELNSRLRDRTSALQVTSSLVRDVKEELETTEPSLIDSEKAASLAVQESSLKLSFRGGANEDPPPFTC